MKDAARRRGRLIKVIKKGLGKKGAEARIDLADVERIFSPVAGEKGWRDGFDWVARAEGWLWTPSGDKVRVVKKG